MNIKLEKEYHCMMRLLLLLLPAIADKLYKVEESNHVRKEKLLMSQMCIFSMLFIEAFYLHEMFSFYACVDIRNVDSS